MQAALEAAMSLDSVDEGQIDVVDVRAELETLVIMRQDLRRVGSLAQELSVDQRLVLSSQIGLQMTACASSAACTAGRRRSTARWHNAGVRA